MPTYDYKCTRCNKIFEVFHGITENPDVLCPECSGVSVRQISGGVGIMFKGPGFYVNDYKKKSAETSSQDQTKSVSSETKKPV